MISRHLVVWWMGLASAMTLAQTSNRVIETASNRIEVLGQTYDKPGAIGPRQSRIVLYSLDNPTLPGATSIFVNGTYHTSLIAGAYSELCYQPGSVELGARQMQAAQRSKDLPDTITALQLEPAQTHYLRVRDRGGRPLLEPVPAAQAERELPARRLQQHTISRVAQDCVIMAEPPKPTQHTLVADTLFAFARSDRNAMTSAGTAAIDQLLARLSQDYSRIDRLHIVGHADPLGDAAINERLAIERANTVRQYIQTHAQPGVPMTAEGRGSREPVLTHCARIDNPQARACHQPNRRVVIEVTGIRR